MAVTSQQLTEFVAGCEKIYNDHCDANGYTIRDPFSCTVGKKYAKVVRGTQSRCVHLFVDLETGDVLKAASWKAPAKGARGNLNDEHKGLSRVTPYGAAHNN